MANFINSLIKNNETTRYKVQVSDVNLLLSINDDSILKVLVKTVLQNK